MASFAHGLRRLPHESDRSAVVRMPTAILVRAFAVEALLLVEGRRAGER